MQNNKGFNLLSVIIIICVTSIISAITAGIIVTNNYGLSYKNITEDSSLSEFLKTYSNIVDNYYEDIDKDKMLDSAINAMLNYLGDNYTTYLNKDQTKELEERLAGSYEGIGISILGKTITNVSKDSPAEKVGLQVGDEFLTVNGTDVSSVTDGASTIISTLIKSSDNKEAKIVIKRAEEELEFTVKIESIPISAISYKLLDNNIGYLKINIFSRPLTDQVKLALKELENNGMNRLIIDLRDNSGGFLDSAETTASIFLEKGKLIYSLEDKKDKEDYYDKTTESKKYPIAVIINNNSASSSEILAAALKDSYGATLIGEKSFGKGKVQQTIDLSSGAMAKYTSAKWLRPNGECIDGVGLIPDYEIQLAYEYDENGNEISTIDTQLNKAIEVIGAM